MRRRGLLAEALKTCMNSMRKTKHEEFDNTRGVY